MDNMQDQFKVIVVDDNRNKANALTALFEMRGYTVQAVTGEIKYDKKTYNAISNAHNDGLIPVIHLDEHSQKWSHISSSEMIVEIINTFSKGGILLTGSIDPHEQFERWQESIPVHLNDWNVSEFDVLNEVRTDKLESILKEYLDTKESKSEFKNR